MNKRQKNKKEKRHQKIVASAMAHVNAKMAEYDAKLDRLIAEQEERQGYPMDYTRYKKMNAILPTEQQENNKDLLQQTYQNNKVTIMGIKNPFTTQQKFIKKVFGC